MSSWKVLLEGGAPWGLRIQGGTEFNEPFRIAKINPNSKAANQGLKAGDIVEKVNYRPTKNLKLSEALELIRNTNQSLLLDIKRSSSNNNKGHQHPSQGLKQTSNSKQLYYNNHVDPEDKYRSPTPALSYSNALASHLTPANISPLEDESGSTSDSASSIIHVSESRRSSFGAQSDIENGVRFFRGDNKMNFRGTPSPVPSTLVWSPSGQHKVKTYKPVSFSGGPSSNRNTPISFHAGARSSPQFGHSISWPEESTQQQDSQKSHFAQSGFVQSGHHSQVSSQRNQIKSPPTLPKPQKFPTTTSEASQPIWQKDSSFNSEGGIHAPKESYLVKQYTRSSDGDGTNVEDKGVQNLNKDNTLQKSEVGWKPSVKSNATLTVKHQGPLSSSAPARTPIICITPPPIEPKLRPFPSGRSDSHSPRTADKGLGLFLNQRSRLKEDADPLPVKPSVSSLPSSPLTGRPSRLKQHLDDHPLDKVVLSSSAPGSSDKGAASSALGGRVVRSKAIDIKPLQVNFLPKFMTNDGDNVKKPADTDMSQYGPKSSSFQSSSFPSAGGWGRTTDLHTDKSASTEYQPVRVEVTTNQKTAAGVKASPCVATTTPHIVNASGDHTSQPSWNGPMNGVSRSPIRLPQTKSATVTLLQRNREKRKLKQLADSQLIENGDKDAELQSANHKPDDLHLANHNAEEKPLANHVSAVLPKTVEHLVPNARVVHVEENEVPEGAVLLGTEEVIEGDKKHTDSYYLVPTHETSQTVTKEIKAPRYQGIGPVDDTTGMPVGFRKHVDEKLQKDWYKQIYRTLHKTDKAKEEPNPYTPTYSFPDTADDASDGKRAELDRSLITSPTPPKMSWSEPDARYTTDKYRNQPKSIADYEPGKSSIAMKEAKSNRLYNPPIEKPGQYSQYTDSKKDIEIHKVNHPEHSSSEDPSRSHELYKNFLKGGDIPVEGLKFPVPSRREDDWSETMDIVAPELFAKQDSLRHQMTVANNGPGQSLHKKTAHSGTTPAPAQRSRSLNESDRQRRDTQNAQRKEQLQRYTEEQKYKRLEQEMQNAEARRHHDYYLDGRYWMELAGVADKDDNRQSKLVIRQKNPVPTDRFEDFDASAKQIQRPAKKVNTQIHGKAKALYTFRPQNKRELPFKKGDTVYIVNRIDHNWYEGERNGIRGIFPCNYVEVLMSLEEATETFWTRQGEARVKYNFIPQTDQELAMKKGDIVELIRRVDDNWYEGRLGNRQGIFPISYVETYREPDTPLLTPLPSLAPTPIPGSPGPVSPGSTVSNAPSIPTAPQSPHADNLDSFDFSQPFDFGLSQLSTRGTTAYSTLPRSYPKMDRSEGVTHAMLQPSSVLTTQASYDLHTPLTNPVRNQLPGGAGTLIATQPAGRNPVQGATLNQPTVLNDLRGSKVTTTQPTNRAPLNGTAGSMTVPQNNYRSTSSSGYESDSALGSHYDGRASAPLFKAPYGENSWGTSTLPINKTGGRGPTVAAQSRGTMNTGVPYGGVPYGGVVRTEYTGPVQETGLYQPPRPVSAMAAPITVNIKPVQHEKARVRFDNTAVERQEQKSATRKLPLYRARYSYHPQNPDELELREGDNISVMEKCDDGWYVGISQRTSEFGTFPGNFVELV